jgi:hypothetical protein
MKSKLLSKFSNKLEDRPVNNNGLPKPLKINCFQCKKNVVEVKYVVPNKSYSKKNNWEY